MTTLSFAGTPAISLSRSGWIVPVRADGNFKQDEQRDRKHSHQRSQEEQGLHSILPFPSRMSGPFARESPKRPRWSKTSPPGATGGGECAGAWYSRLTTYVRSRHGPVLCHGKRTVRLPLHDTVGHTSYRLWARSARARPLPLSLPGEYPL
jgi:hypothetical protein